MKRYIGFLFLIGCVSHNNNDQATPPQYNNVGDTIPTSPTNSSTVIPAQDASVDTSLPPTESGGCSRNSDCESNVCNYNHICIPTSEKSCAAHFGGDTCGAGEVGGPNAIHESCCKSLLVNGFTDPNHPGKQVYLGKYEITAGRIRAFIKDITVNGKPDVKSWMTVHRPTVWDSSWEDFLPTDNEGGFITINRLLLGDPRHDGQTQEQAGPGVILPPATDQVVNLGINHQFGAQIYADLHGNNCGVFPGSFGFPTYYYPPDVLKQNNEVPRSVSQDVLDTKSMNCITNVMLAAFCVWDGGQLATADVIDFVTDSKNSSNDVSGCGSQYDNHGELLGNIFTNTVESGGRCAPLITINATFDAGDTLPVPGSFLNNHVYHFPDLGVNTSDKVWQIAAPGRITNDVVNIRQGDEPWMDIAGNLSESVLDNSGHFGLRLRGIGYGSSRSDLNVTHMPGETILRVQRPEAKSALVGGRCLYYK